MTEPAEATVLLEIEGLGVRRQRERLLEDVTLRVRRGSVHVVMGANGAGKSTMLTAILGQIAFDGRIAMNWTGPGTIGYVPQSFAVDPTLPVTVADFLALTRQRVPNLPHAQSVIDDLMMLRDKTRGNLEPDEEEQLTTVIGELQRHYVTLAQERGTG